MTNETFKFYGILPNSLLWSARVNGSHLSTTFYDSLVALFNNSASFQTTAVLFHLIWLWSKCFCPLASGPRAICPRSCICHPSCLHDFYPGFHTYYLPCLVHEIKWGKICGKRKENKPTPLTKLRARRRRPLFISFIFPKPVPLSDLVTPSLHTSPYAHNPNQKHYHHNILSACTAICRRVYIKRCRTMAASHP